MLSAAEFEKRIGTGEQINRGGYKDILTYTTYAGSPVGNVTPDFIGQGCLDTSNDNFYTAVGETSADWKPSASDILGTVASATITSLTATSLTATDLKLSAADNDSLHALAGYGVAHIRGDSLSEGDSLNQHTCPAPVAGRILAIHCDAGDSDSTAIVIFGDSDDSIKVGGGTGTTATFNAAGEALILHGRSATRWDVLSNVGSVAIS